MLYHLSKTRIYRQTNDNWCWAACFLWIIKFLKIKSIYNTELKILRYYFEFLLRPLNPPTSDEELHSNFYNWGIEFNLIPKLIEDILTGATYESSKIHHLSPAEKAKYLKKKLSYENIKEELSKNKAPFIVFSKSHMILITGFGKKDDCEYLLKSDPKKGDIYMNCDEFISLVESDIRGIWTLKNENDNELLRAQFFEETKTLYQKIKSINLRYNPDDLLKNNFLNIIPLSASMKQIIQTHPDNNTTHLEHRLANLLKEFNLNTNCLPLDFLDALDKKDLENTTKIIQSYIFSEGRSVSIDYLDFVIESNNVTEEFKLIDRNNNLEFLNKKKRLNFLEIKSFMN